MKKIIYYAVLLGAVFAASSCTNDPASTVVTGLDDTGDEVRVAFNVDMGRFLTDIEIEPMTRVADPNDGNYVLNVRKDYMVYLLKKVDGVWYEFDMMELALFDYHKKIIYDSGEVNIPVFNPTGSSGESTSSPNYLYRLTADQLTAGFDMELTPGDYLITIVLNPTLGKWAREADESFLHGRKVDPNDPPYVIQYTGVSQSYWNSVGKERTLSLGGEIFVGCSEFTVVKSTDLGLKGPEQFVDIDLKRMTGKMRFLLKNEPIEDLIKFAPAGENNNDGSGNPNQFGYELQPTSGVNFYRGVDIFGNFKGEVDNLFLSASFTREEWMTSLTGTGQYIVSRDGGRTNSLYIFAHPDEQVPARFGPVSITRMSGTPAIEWKETTDFILRGNRWHAFSFEMTG